MIDLKSILCILIYEKGFHRRFEEVEMTRVMQKQMIYKATLAGTDDKARVVLIGDDNRPKE